MNLRSMWRNNSPRAPVNLATALSGSVASAQAAGDDKITLISLGLLHHERGHPQKKMKKRPPGFDMSIGMIESDRGVAKIAQMVIDS